MYVFRAVARLADKYYGFVVYDSVEMCVPFSDTCRMVRYNVNDPALKGEFMDRIEDTPTEQLFANVTHVYVALVPSNISISYNPDFSAASTKRHTRPYTQYVMHPNETPHIERMRRGNDNDGVLSEILKLMRYSPLFSAEVEVARQRFEATVAYDAGEPSPSPPPPPSPRKRQKPNPNDT